MGIQEEVIAGVMQQELKALDQRYQELNAAKLQIEKDMATVKAQFDCIVRIADTANARITEIAKAAQSKVQQQVNETVKPAVTSNPNPVVQEPAVLEPPAEAEEAVVQKTQKPKPVKAKKEEEVPAVTKKEPVPTTHETVVNSEDEDEWSAPPLTQHQEPPSAELSSNEDDWLD